jgi:hypothetical protein
MADTPKRIEVNCETGEQKVVELTAKEIAQIKADAIVFAELEAQRQAEAQAKAEAKASALAKLEALGLTEKEAAALIS